MAVTNETINTLGKISSMLNTLGNGIVDKLQYDSDKKISDASSLINDYYTNSTTGKVAQILTYAQSEQDLNAQLQGLQNEIKGLNRDSARSTIKGLDGFQDSVVDNALSSFKNSAGTYFASSYIRGTSAIQKKNKSNIYSGITSVLESKTTDYVNNATDYGDVAHAQGDIENILANLTIDDLKNAGIAGRDEDLEKYLEEYKASYKEQWTASSLLYANEMNKADISSSFEKSLQTTFTLDHAPDTFVSTTTTTEKDEQGNNVEVSNIRYLVDDGATSWKNAKTLYQNAYDSNSMDISDPNGYQSADSKLGETAIWGYVSDSFLYNFGYYSVSNEDWLDVNAEDKLRSWAEQALSGATHLSEDEKRELIDEFVSGCFDSSGNIVSTSTIATGLAESAKDSQKKVYNMFNEVKLADISDSNGVLDGDKAIAKAQEYGIDVENNAYDKQLFTQYISSVLGFQIDSSDLSYMDELFYLRNEIAEMPYKDPEQLSWDEIENPDGSGETISTRYYSYFNEAYKSYIAEHGIEDSAEYKYGFIKAMNDAVTSECMELSSTVEEDLKEKAEKYTTEQYMAYCNQLAVEGSIPTQRALEQAYALAPVEDYKSEQSTVEGMLGSKIKSALGDEGYSYYMTGTDTYPRIRKEINEKLVEFGGDINSTEFQNWLTNYANDMIYVYSNNNAESLYKDAVKSLTGYGSSTATSKILDVLDYDDRTFFYKYKQGDFDGMVNMSAVDKVVSELTGANYEVEYDDLRNTVYDYLYPNNQKGWRGATESEKANVLLALEVGTLTVQEQRGIEVVFGSTGAPKTCTPVAFENGGQAYIFSNGLVVWNESVEDGTYRLAKLNSNFRVSDFSKTLHGDDAETVLYKEDLDGITLYKRTKTQNGKAYIPLSIDGNYINALKTLGIDQ